jgi:AAA+ superfamily predicted ATPase
MDPGSKDAGPRAGADEPVPPAAPAPPAGAGAPPTRPSEPLAPYHSHFEHLEDHLRRIDELVRAQTHRWRDTVATTKPENLWGMVHVTEAEVEAYLRAPFRLPWTDAEEAEEPIRRRLQGAATRARVAARRVEATPSEVDLRIRRLMHAFDLSEVERDVLLVCLLPEVDARYRRLFGYLQDDASRTRPGVELILAILRPEVPDPATGRSLFDSASTLVRRHLVIVGDGDEPVSVRPARLDDRIASFLLGDDDIDPRLAGVVRHADRGVLPRDLAADLAQISRLEGLSQWLLGRGRRGTGAVLFLHGPYGSGRRAAAQAICSSLRVPLLAIDTGRALAELMEWKELVERTYREGALQGAAVLWTGCDALLSSEQSPQRWNRLLEAAEASGLVTFLASEVPWDPADRFRHTPFVRIDFRIPGYALRREIWLRHLPPIAAFADPPPDRDHLASMLANGFQLTEEQIVDAITSAKGHARQREPLMAALSVEDFFEGCRRQSGRRLISFARRIEPRTDLTFDDLILPKPSERQLGELRARIRQRNYVYSGLGFERRLPLGNGLIAMFTGSSGTGKTMAAELLAREQGVDLYKIDLSAVVSKYVGETEKNLAHVFDEAEEANAILFFDEADALFGKRGEVKEARDRWANIEINFLLQRVEEYAGVVILASNLQQNIDEAFLRRIHVIVDFPFPDDEARFRIWRGMFPAEVDRPPDEELVVLAQRFRLSGGSQKNIVVDAAFRALEAAVQARPRITTRHLVAATAREYQKLGRPITKGEFSEEFYRWVEEDIL